MYLAGKFINLIPVLVELSLRRLIHFQAHAVNMGNSKESSSLLLSVVGISSMIGRLINGFLADRPKVSTHFMLFSNIVDHYLNLWKVNVLILNNLALTVGGALIVACPFFVSYELLLFFSVLLGLALCKSTSWLRLRGNSLLFFLFFKLTLLCAACTAVTRPILLGKLLGLENVNNSYGFMLVFYGVASLFGTPLAGMLIPLLTW